MILNPCPTCGKRFDFPLTGCMTFVEEFLEASGGKCPECGTQVVVDLPPEPSAWERAEDIRSFPLEDLELSVRARVVLNRLGINTVGELLELSATQIANLGGKGAEGAICELNEVLEIKGVRIE